MKVWVEAVLLPCYDDVPDYMDWNGFDTHALSFSRGCISPFWQDLDENYGGCVDVFQCCPVW